LFVVEKPVGIVDNFMQCGLWKTKNAFYFLEEAAQKRLCKFPNFPF